jgi:hypothetical protein
LIQVTWRQAAEILIDGGFEEDMPDDLAARVRAIAAGGSPPAARTSDPPSEGDGQPLAPPETTEAVRTATPPEGEGLAAQRPEVAGPADASSGTPSCAEDLGVDEDTEKQVTEILSQNPRTSLREVAKQVGRSTGYACRARAWKANQVRLKEQKARASVRARPLTRKILAAFDSKAADPYEIVADQDERERQEHTLLEDPEAIAPIEVLRRRYLEGANAQQRARFHDLNPTDQEHELRAWELTGDRLAE